MSDIFKKLSNSQTLDINNQRYSISNLSSSIELVLPTVVNRGYFEFLVSNPFGFSIICKSTTGTINNSSSFDLSTLMRVDNDIFDIRVLLLFEEETNNWRIF